MKSFQELYKQAPNVLVQPFYHMISDSQVSYVKHLYSYRNINEFTDDINFFLKHYKFVDVLQIIQSVESNSPLQDYSLHLSFDDGFRELYEVVAPILLEKGVPATFFINKNFLDNREMFYRNKASLLIEHFILSYSDIIEQRTKELFKDHGVAYNSFAEAILSLEYREKHIIDQLAIEMDFSFDDFMLKERPYLTTAQVNEMIAKGFHFGAHSIDHPKYSTISLKEQLHQTRESMQFVNETFNPAYKVFAFPFNDLSVSKLFYQTIFDENTLQLSFGTAEMIDDWHPRNLQRTWFEKTDLNAEDLLIRNYTSREERVATNTNVMSRSYGEIRTFTISQLEKAIEENVFWKDQDNFPITKYRARAQTKNPRADKDDLALVTMYDNDKLIGYLGVLPDTLFLGNQETKWGWLTCWWTHPEYGGKGIGQQILDKIHEVYNGNIGCSEFTEFGQIAANRSEKLNPFSIDGKEFIFNSSSYEALEKRATHNNDATIELEYVKEIDSEVSDFILTNRKNELTRRGTDELNWILQNPWVIAAPFKDSISEKTYFSSVSESFNYYAFKVFSNKKIGAFIILKVRNGKMTIPYLYLSSMMEKSALINIILSHVQALKCSSLKTFNQDIISAMKQITGVFEEQDCQKKAFFSKKIDLNQILPLHIQDGDGDNGFT